MNTQPSFFLVRRLTASIPTVLFFAEVCAAQTTPWHLQKRPEFNFLYSVGSVGGSGFSLSSGNGDTEIPTGSMGVIEHISLRCSAEASVQVLVATVQVLANPANPGEVPSLEQGVNSGAEHPLLLQVIPFGTSGSATPPSNYFLASQPMRLLIDSYGHSQILFNFTLQNSSTATAIQSITCLASISGYIEKDGVSAAGGRR